jgi:methylthioribose-1-phosphate isomerase
MKSIEWCGNSVRLIDQTKLPLQEIYIHTDDYKVLADAISTMKIRGAPAIGITAAYGIALAALKCHDDDVEEFRISLLKIIGEFAKTRPTAVNLFWALDRMKCVFQSEVIVEEIKSRLLDEAKAIHREDEEMCNMIGKHGSKLIPEHAAILTHCNTGALATGGQGTAQNIIATAHQQGKSIKVYADETRPALQGARLTTWELIKLGIDVTLITDNMAAFLMQQKKIDLVVVGADRIAANGDVANKIGTYGVAVCAKYHQIPFYVAAPSSTIDLKTLSGDMIKIEERDKKEVLEIFGKRIAHEKAQVYSPAFDITPSNLITAIITEKGIHYPPFDFHQR